MRAAAVQAGPLGNGAVLGDGVSGNRLVPPMDRLQDRFCGWQIGGVWALGGSWLNSSHSLSLPLQPINAVPLTRSAQLRRRESMNSLPSGSMHIARCGGSPFSSFGSWVS
jgi:hypothetical protein